ncbi:MAG TPA: nitroreductase [Steroidobacteraceae bacterium]|nr:nitroreductase [Steroidobacteraceae bacterium]
MQAIDLLLKRRSARSLTEPAPDAAALELILASAARAPDHGRLRPWRFVVIRAAARERFGDLLAEQLRRAHPGSTPETLERERGKALRAPLIVVVGAHLNTQMPKVPPVEQLLAVGAAAEAMMLAAVALGFNGMWKTGAPAYDEQVKAALGFESGDAIVGFMYLGTEAAAAAGDPPEDRWRDLVREF